MYHVFYNNVRLGEEVPSSAPVPVELADVYSEIFPFVKEEGKFFGLIDSQGTTLQAMYDADQDKYWFEVPRPDLNGSFGAYLSFDDAADLIKAVTEPFPIDGYSNFKFSEW